jgi:type II secretory pathway component PulF
MQSGTAVISLAEDAPAQTRQRRIATDHGILILKQLALMLGAGVQLLDAIETLAASLPGANGAAGLRNVAQTLRRGDRLGDALEEALPIYPAYVYGLVRAGEASGKLARVLAEAAQQLAFERRVQRDIMNALTYPAFLVVSGAGSVAFLLYAVVPRFAAMLENTRTRPTGAAQLVLNAGVAFHDNAPLILALLAAMAVALFLLIRSPATRPALLSIADTIPGLRGLLRARQQSAWTRIAALSLDAEVGILDAIALAVAALPDGRLKTSILAAAPALRAGRAIDAAFRDAGAVSQIDASLLRAGQRSGALAPMMHAVADRHEENFRDALRRFVSVVEPLAIAVVALMVGSIVLALASALVGVYETIG